MPAPFRLFLVLVLMVALLSLNFGDCFLRIHGSTFSKVLHALNTLGTAAVKLRAASQGSYEGKAPGRCSGSTGERFQANVAKHR